MANKDFITEKEFYSVGEFMTFTGISRPLAYSLIARGEVAVVRLGKRILIPGWYLRKLASEPGKQGD